MLANQSIMSWLTHIHSLSAFNQVSQINGLRREMLALNRMKEEQQKRLNERRAYLAKCDMDAASLNRQIHDLNIRLEQKKQVSGNVVDEKNDTNTFIHPPSSKMHTIIAAVEPLIKQTEPNVSYNLSWFLAFSGLNLLKKYIIKARCTNYISVFGYYIVI